ncbi:MAG: polysaccharide biosynthesis tyrosine autokinase [Bacteroidales bacterium]|nr:polysaccharide biosynthesis tyrosine autokinase [Bacteroidales bacterium]
MAKKNTSDFIDVKFLFKQYLSKWYYFVISVVLCVGLAYAYTRIHQSEFAVRANVLISQDDNNMMGGGDMAGLGALGNLFGSSAYVEDEVFVISSHSLYSQVAKELGINVQYYVREGFMRYELSYPNHPVSVTPQAGMVDTLSMLVDFKIDVNEKGEAAIQAKMRREKIIDVKNVRLPYTAETVLGSFTFTPTAAFPAGEAVKERAAVMSYDMTAELLDRDVQTEIASKRTNVIRLGINTTNAAYGKAILDKIIEEYNKRGIYEKTLQNENTAKFLDERLKLISADLDHTEAEIQNYKQDRGMIDLEAKAMYQTEKRAKLEEALITATTERNLIELAREFLRDPANAYSPVPVTPQTASLAEVIGNYNLMIIERQNMLASALPENAALKLLSSNIDIMRRNLQESVQSALDQSNIAIRDAKRELDATDSQLGSIPREEREYINMRRQQEVQSQIYIFLLQHREEASMLIANAVPKGQVIDNAFTFSEPLGMSRRTVLMLGLLLGLCFPPVLLYIMKIINNRFETREEVERLSDVPVLGEMSISRSGKHLVATPDSTSSTAELFRLMRSNLLFILNGANDKVVLLTSSTSGEGKSFISINLAASLGMLGKKTLLVGMDIRKPRLAEYLGVAPRFGLTQYLSSDKISVQDLINPVPGAVNLDVIVSGPVPPNPAELLLSDRVDKLFVELRTMYDYIIVDTAPIGIVSDTFTLDRIADAAIYVCRANYTQATELRTLNDIYEQGRLKKLSLVINGTAAKKTYGYAHQG